MLSWDTKVELALDISVTCENVLAEDVQVEY